MRDAVLFLYKIGEQVFEVMGTFDVQMVVPEHHSPEVETFIDSIMSGALDTFKIYEPQTIGQHPNGSTAFASVMRRSEGTVTFRSSSVLSMTRASPMLKMEYVNFLLPEPPQDDEYEDEEDINKGMDGENTVH